MAGTFLAIIFQPLELESCSNPARIRKVLVLVEKTIFDSSSEFSGEMSQVGVFLNFCPTFSGPGRQPNEPFFSSKFFWKLDRDPCL